jgi:hypothetical protein
MKFFLLFFTLFLGQSQKENAKQIVEKCLLAHDPTLKYLKNRHEYLYKIQRENQADRAFGLVLDWKNDFFQYRVKNDSIDYFQLFKKGDCKSSINGNSKPTSDQIIKYQLDCDRTKYLKNVYFYLFGLPFKLKDEGVIIHDLVEEVIFNEKASFKIKVSFDEKVGSDIWYFYIDKQTFLMNGYQFYHNYLKNDGEFIYLKNYEKINGVFIAKTKLWHWNKDQKHFRTDAIF